MGKKREMVIKKTEFAKESEAQSMAVTTAMGERLFVAMGMDEEKMERLNLPRLLKPDQVPVWTQENPVILQGELVRVCPSPNSTIRGFVLWLKTPSGTELTFPCTGVVRSALAPGVKIDDTNETTEEKTTKALYDALQKYVGKTLFFKRTESVMNKTYQRDMFMFDVWAAKIGC